MLKELSYLEKNCIRYCIKYKTAIGYKSKKGLTDDETIDYYINSRGYNRDKTFELDEICKVAELDIHDVNEFIKNVTIDQNIKNPGFILGMTDADWVISYMTTQKNQTVETICEIANISVPRFKGIQRKHSDWTKEEILFYCVINKPQKENKWYKLNVNGNTYNLSKLCKLLELDYTSILRQIKSEEDIIPVLLKTTDKVYENILGEIIFEIKEIEEKAEVDDTRPLYVKCKELGLDANAVRIYKNRHPHISDELAIKRFLHPEKLTFKDKCNIANIKYKKLYIIETLIRI